MSQGKFINLVGQRFSQLTVLEKVASDAKRNTRWLCRCDCGNEIITVGNRLMSNHTKSCGCLRKKYEEHNPSYSHGLSSKRIYKIWMNMKHRCYNPKAKCYHRYGKKGICICDIWLNDFTAFYSWALTNGYTDKLTIDRIDKNKNYEPENCQWITKSENSKKDIIGEKCHFAKLTQKQVEEIKERIRSGEKCVLLAKDYRVATVTVYSIKYGKRWKNEINSTNR